METEEFGSVYESLLELTPHVSEGGTRFSFLGEMDEDKATDITVKSLSKKGRGGAKGSHRKTTGSYYTPDTLVQLMLDQALDPVIARKVAEHPTNTEALLTLKVIDPACGSGHFVLAAARRIARRLAELRHAGSPTLGQYRHALRDVARHCIHGVDRNPMAVELCKVAIWIEAVEPGKPLGFLDANIRCGDALLGVFDRDALVSGIPDEAYKALTGDDKAAARDLGRKNSSEKAAQGKLGLDGGASTLPPVWPAVDAAERLRSMPEETIEDVVARQRAFGRGIPSNCTLVGMACDLHVAAYLMPKRLPAGQGTWDGRPPTTGDVALTYGGHAVDRGLLDGWTKAAEDARALHWFLSFPDVMKNGGFDVVLGNPPWEVVQLGEEEYFAQRVPEIASLVGVNRKRAIAALEIDRPEMYFDYM